MRRRLVRAVFALTLSFCLIVTGDFISDRLLPGLSKGESAAEESSNSMLKLSKNDSLWEMESFLESLDSSSWPHDLEADEGSSILPPQFEEELFSATSFEELRSAGNGLIIGGLKAGSAASCFSSLKDELISRNWALLESGQQERASFVKASGFYRWLYLSCDDISGSCSVLVVLDKPPSS